MIAASIESSTGTRVNVPVTSVPFAVTATSIVTVRVGFGSSTVPFASVVYWPSLPYVTLDVTFAVASVTGPASSVTVTVAIPVSGSWVSETVRSVVDCVLSCALTVAGAKAVNTSIVARSVATSLRLISSVPNSLDILNGSSLNAVSDWFSPSLAGFTPF